jgi:hypothetical protein
MQATDIQFPLGPGSQAFQCEGVNHAGAGSMNRMKFNLVKAFLQNSSPEVVLKTTAS